MRNLLLLVPVLLSVLLSPKAFSKSLDELLADLSSSSLDERFDALDHLLRLKDQEDKNRALPPLIIHMSKLLTADGYALHRDMEFNSVYVVIGVLGNDHNNLFKEYLGRLPTLYAGLGSKDASVRASSRNKLELVHIVLAAMYSFGGDTAFSRIHFEKAKASNVLHFSFLMIGLKRIRAQIVFSKKLPGEIGSYSPSILRPLIRDVFLFFDNNPSKTTPFLVWDIFDEEIDALASMWDIRSLDLDPELMILLTQVCDNMLEEARLANWDHKALKKISAYFRIVRRFGVMDDAAYNKLLMSVVVEMRNVDHPSKRERQDAASKLEDMLLGEKDVFAKIENALDALSDLWKNQAWDSPSKHQFVYALGQLMARLTRGERKALFQRLESSLDKRVYQELAMELGSALKPISELDFLSDCQQRFQR